MPTHVALYEPEGGALFVLTNGAIAYASWVTAHRWLMESRLRLRLVATGVLGTVAVILLAEGLSSLGWYPRGAVALAAFLTAVATHVMWGAAAAALAAWRTLVHPPLGWDSLTYHLVFAAGRGAAHAPVRVERRLHGQPAGRAALRQCPSGLT